MLLQENVGLKPFFSLALPARARWLVEAESSEELAEAAQWARQHDVPILLLGGGTNIVLQQDWDGLVIRMKMRGIEACTQPDGDILLRVAAGEDWPALVHHCQQQGWSGLENLAMIPGCVGAAPVRNIGAYGREVAQLLTQVEMFDLAEGKASKMPASECDFSYRNSAFISRKMPPKLAITAVHLRLRPAAAGIEPDQLTHPAVRQKLSLPLEGQVDKPVSISSDQLYDTVCALRTERLPDPGQLPNVGSFFTNPIVSAEHWHRLHQRLPELPSRCEAKGRRLSAAWLITEAGWKGHRQGNVAVWKHHALILTNPGGGSGEELMRLASSLRSDIHNRYGVQLEYEPLVY